MASDAGLRDGSIRTVVHAAANASQTGLRHALPPADGPAIPVLESLRAEVHVLKDAQGALTPEIMNSRDEPDRVRVFTHRAEMRGRTGG